MGINSYWERKTMKDWFSDHWQILLIACASIAVVILFWVVTPYGVRIGHDSLFYIDAAINLSEGNGFFWIGSGGELKPLSHFPPGYPVLLALPMLFNIEKIQATRIISAFLIGANFFTLSFILYRFWGNVFLPVLTSLMIMSTPVLVELYFNAMSEPLFFILILAGFFGVVRYSTSNKTSQFILVAALIGFATLTRYTGIAVLVTSIIGIFFFLDGTLKEKILRSATHGLIAGFPIGLWMIRNWHITGSLTNRTFQVHLVDLDTLRSLLDVIFDWVTKIYLSHWVEGLMLIIFILGILAYGVWQIRRRLQEPSHSNRYFVLLIIFVCIYLGQLMVSLSFFDASTRINDRILSPIYLSFALILFLATASTNRKQINAVLTLSLLAILILGPYPMMLEQSIDSVSSIWNNGAGFAALGWRESELISYIQSRESNATIITNQAMAVRFLTGNPAIQVPERWDPVKEQERTDYLSELNEMLALLEAPNSYVVLFAQNDLSTNQDLEWLDAFTLALEVDGGSVYTMHKGR